MENVFQTLQERGFVKQCTDAETLARILSEKPLTCYAGFDPTASSLHCGSLVPIMAMAHLQRAGHKPIAIIGGGTAMVGDPSGKTELRKMLTLEQIQENGRGILGQLQRYLNLNGETGLFLNNGDWLLNLRYVDFLRDIGRYFRVNEMLRAESYRARLEREEGLSFIEFNYQLLQAYDFLKLFQDHQCTLQIGGDDQWSNILAGTDLIRRLESKDAFGLTFPLLTTARGEKMGKTAAGAIWLDAERTKPYDFYQYWVNVDDRDVERFLAYFTFLPMEEVRRLGKLEGSGINDAKRILAFEATALCHGIPAAEEAKAAADIFKPGAQADLSGLPTTTIPRSRLETGIPAADLFVECGLATSKGEARRLFQGGGGYVNDDAVKSHDQLIDAAAIQEDGSILIRAGKKKYHRIIAG